MNRGDIVSLFDETQIHSLIDLRREYEKCERCELCHTRSKVVMWCGPDKTDLMVVGQSPGATEDDCGVPFSGRAGKRLDDVLRLVGIPRGRIHISNAVWCRNTDGQKNMTPTSDHISACNDRLHKEIALVDPTHIVCLGREAMHAVIGVPLTAAVGKERAKGWRTLIISGKPRDVMVSWHPAYELRATQQKNFGPNHDMASDWRDIAAKLPHLVEE